MSRVFMHGRGMCTLRNVFMFNSTLSEQAGFRGCTFKLQFVVSKNFLPSATLLLVPVQCYFPLRPLAITQKYFLSAGRLQHFIL